MGSPEKESEKIRSFVEYVFLVFSKLLHPVNAKLVLPRATGKFLRVMSNHFFTQKACVLEFPGMSRSLA
jgi:hypothetical protein